MAVANLLSNKRENTPVTEKTFTVFKDGMFSYFRETLSLEKKETARLQRIYRETEESKLEAKTEAVSGTPKKIRERKRGGGLSSILKDALVIGGLTILANNAEDLIKTFGSIAGSVKSLIDEIDKLPDLSELDDLLGLLAVLAGAGFLPLPGGGGGRRRGGGPKPGGKTPTPKPAEAKPPTTASGEPEVKPTPKPAEAKPTTQPQRVTPAQLAAEEAGTLPRAREPAPHQRAPTRTPAQLAAEEAGTLPRAGEPVRETALSKKIRSVARNGKEIAKGFAKELPGAALFSAALEAYFGREEILEAAANRAADNPSMSEDEFKKGMLEDIEKVWIDGAKAVIGQTLGGAAGATVGLAVPIPGAAFALGILGGVAGDAVAKLIPTEFIQKILPDSLKNFFSEGIYDMMFNGDPRKFRSMLRELELKGNIIKLEMAQKKNADDLSKRLREVAGEGKTGLAALEDTRLKELEQEGADVQERLDKARTQLTVLEKVSEGVSYEQLARRELGLKDSPIAGASKAVNESVAKRAAEIRERTQKAIDASQGEVFINPPITTNAPPPNVTNTVIPGQQQQVQQPAQQQPSIETRNPDRTLDQSRNQTHFYNESGSSFAIAAP